MIIGYENKCATRLIILIKKCFLGKKTSIFLFQFDLTLSPASWKHIRALYNVDRLTPHRICPKLTDSHVESKQSTKMKVLLAAQVNV